MIRLHHCPQTRSMRSLWLLHELDVPFDVVTYPFDKSLRSASYLEKHPVGRVPCLELDGRTIWETGAIAEVLCERFPDPGLGRAPTHPERADWLIWLHFAETISHHIATLTQQHIILREDWMRSPTLMALEAKRLAKCYQALEAQLTVSGGASVLASGFSAVDIGLAQAVYMGRYFAPIAPFAKVRAWYSTLSHRPGFQNSLPKTGEAVLYDRDFYPPWDREYEPKTPQTPSPPT